MIYKTIRLLRSQKEITQLEMAETLNISVNTYSKIENGTTKLIDYERIKTLAQKLEISLSELLVSGLDASYAKKEDTQFIGFLLNQIAMKDKEIDRLYQQNDLLLKKALN